MKFCWVTLHVADFEKSLAFYHELLGLPVDRQLHGNGIKMAMLGEKEEAKVEILQGPAKSEEPLHSDISVGLAVESLDSTMEYLKDKGIPILRGPISPAPNIRFIFIQDPDGYEVQLVEMR